MPQCHSDIIKLEASSATLPKLHLDDIVAIQTRSAVYLKCNREAFSDGSEAAAPTFNVPACQIDTGVPFAAKRAHGLTHTSFANTSS